MNSPLWPNPSPGNRATSHLRGLKRQNVIYPSPTSYILILHSVPLPGAFSGVTLPGPMASTILLLCLGSHSMQNVIPFIIL